MQEVEALEDRRRLGGVRRLGGGDSARAQEEVEEPLAGLTIGADHHVVEDGEALGEARNLEGAAEPPRRDAFDAAERQGPAVELHLSAIGRVDAGYDVEQRRLARAVGPDQADDLARPDLKADAAERLEPAEGEADVSDRQHRALSFARGTSLPGGRGT